MARSTVQILEATLRLVVQGGVHAVRYREVAQEAGVSLGTISYQFASREELIRETFQHALRESVSSMRSLAAQRAPRSLEDIASLCTEILRNDFAQADKPYLAEYELLLYAARDEQVAAALRESDREIVLELGSMLERLGMPSPLAAAQTVLDLVRGYQLGVLGDEGRDLDEFERRLARVLRSQAGAQDPSSSSGVSSSRRR
jgi:TetR/AcrR family transcriptional regulator, regulator of biofilm formation and stress response